MQEDAKQDCKECNGEGEVYKYFANHKDKYVLFEWLYCTWCFPDSSGSWPSESGMVEISSNKFDLLINLIIQVCARQNK